MTWREYWKQLLFDIFGTERPRASQPEPARSPYLLWPTIPLTIPPSPHSGRGSGQAASDRKPRLTSLRAFEHN